MDRLNNLDDLFTHELKDLYSAEQQILKALHEMAQATKHAELRTAFEEHEAMTREQVKRLDLIADELGVEITGHKCKGMEGIIKEGKEVIAANADDSARDAALIGAAQRVEHYEIAGYGCARTYAHMLGLNEQAEVLQRTLDEEGDTDEKLTDLAESVVNIDALK